MHNSILCFIKVGKDIRVSNLKFECGQLNILGQNFNFIYMSHRNFIL